MGSGTPFALVCVLSAALVSGGCRQLLGLDDPTRRTQDAAVDAIVAVDAIDAIDAALGIPVRLGTASNYVVLAQASIGGTGATIKGNVGISPATATNITGFSLIADASTEFSTSLQVTGKVYAANYGGPTPANLQTAANDMQVAYTEASERVPDFTELQAGNISGTLAAGVYRWSAGLSILENIYLTGSATDVWIFQIAGTLNIAANTDIVLTGGALPKNVFWQSSGTVTLGAMGHLKGVLLTATGFTSGSGSTINGRVLSLTDVTIANSTVNEPAP